MFLLATQAEPQMLEFAHPNLGRLVQPRHYARVRDTAERGVPWAADNDAFNGGVDAAKFLTMLEAISSMPGCRFVAVPDVVADATATLREFERWLPCLLDYDLPLAFVLQDGIAAPAIPWDLIEAVFIGGSDSFKLGEQARQIVAEAQDRGKWIHMACFIAFKSSTEQTATLTPRTSVCVARARSSSKTGTPSSPWTMSRRPSSVSMATCSPLASWPAIEGWLLRKDSPVCTWPLAAAATAATRLKFSISGATTMSTSFVPRTTPQALTARPPISTNSTSASESRRRS